MAVKFAVYEMMRNLHGRLNGGRPANVAEDLIMGGVAGAAAAAATTPLDVVKTIMMCSASSRPTILSAAAGIMREGQGLRPFFRGVGPRALSNGLNSAIFFCFFEAIRQVRGAARGWQRREHADRGRVPGREREVAALAAIAVEDRPYAAAASRPIGPTRRSDFACAPPHPACRPAHLLRRRC